MKKIVIAGGTGHLGSSLANRLIQEGHSVRMFTRKVPKNNSRISYSYWDGETPGPWIRDLDGSDVLINLCGKSGSRAQPCWAKLSVRVRNRRHSGSIPAPLPTMVSQKKL